VKGKAVDAVSDFPREVEEVDTLVVCPVWELLSDHMGVKRIAVMKYTIVSITLSCYWERHTVVYIHHDSRVS
jgi:hypothetical protein